MFIYLFGRQSCKERKKWKPRERDHPSTGLTSKELQQPQWARPKAQSRKLFQVSYVAGTQRLESLSAASQGTFAGNWIKVEQAPRTLTKWDIDTAGYALIHCATALAPKILTFKIFILFQLKE